MFESLIGEYTKELTSSPKTAMILCTVEPIRTHRVRTVREFDVLATLFREYADDLGIDLSFQGFESELARLAEMYGPPSGAALLAGSAGDYVGCVGVRRFDERTCEMKRLYVRPSARGRGLGSRLAADAEAAAKELGYRRVVLDTLSTMSAAIRVYESLGFERVEPYYHNPLPTATYFSKRIAS